MLFSNRFCHKFKKAMFIRCDHSIVKFPVHLKLAVGIFMVVLIRAPVKIEHVIADFPDHIITAHHRLLIITWLFGSIIGIGNLVAVWGEQKIFSLDTGLDMHTFGGGLVNQTLQHIARCLINTFAFHHTICCHPCNIRLPRQLDDRCRIWNRKHVWMGWC